MRTHRDATGNSNLKSTHGSLVSTFLHQTEELVRGAVVTVLLVQLLHVGQQLVHDGLQFRTAYCLWRQTGHVVKYKPLFKCVRLCVCVYLDLLQQSLYDSQQDVPGDHLQLFAVLLDQSGDGEDDFIGHHLIGTRHGLSGRGRVS